MAIKFLNSVNADSGVLYVDAANDKVGIGTTSPNRKLTIQNGSYTYPGGIDANSFFAIANDGWAGMNILSSRGTGGFIDFGDLDWGHRGRILYGQSTDYMSFDTAGSTKMTILSGGNVGIGTTSPEGKLNIVADNGSTASAVKTLVLGGGTDTTGNGQYIQFRSSSNATLGSQISGSRTGAGAASDLKFHTTGSDSVVRERMVINSSGNVGIGTTSPGTYDAAKIGSSHRFFNVQAPTGNYAVNTLAGGLSGNGDRIGFIPFVNDTNSASYKYSAWIGSEVEGATANQKGGRLVFSTTSDGSAAGPIERMRITSAGNVGIGTTSPGSKLVVAGGTDTSYNDGTLKVVGSIALNSFNNLNPALNRWVLRVRAGGTEGAFDIYDARNSASRLFISASGSIGIGTTSPNSWAQLETTGTVAVGGILYVKSSQKIQGLTGFPGGAGNLSINPDGGNVGIGTTSPSFKLQVNGDFAAEDNIYLTDAGTVRGKFELNASDRDDLDIKAVSLSSNMKFFTENAERMRITSSGNVGIGTTAPVSLVHASNGNYRVSNETAATFRGYVFGATAGDSTEYSYLKWEPQGGELRLWNNPAAFGGFFSIYTNAVERLRITSAGNVGIGTASPSEKLHVSGNVRIEGDLTVNGSYTQIDTDVNTTEQWNVTNDGTGPAVTINQTGAQDIMDVQDDGTSVFYIEDGGNVGLGTTDPANNLEVSNSNSGGLGATLGIYNPGYNANSSSTINIGRTSDSNWEIKSESNADGGRDYDLIFSERDKDDTAHEEYLRLKSTGALKISSYGSNTFTGTAAYALAVDSSGNVIETSYIPSSSSTDFVAVTGDTMSGGLNIEVSTSNTQLKLKRTTSATGEFNIYTNTDSLFFHNVGQSTYPMMINSSGNVGIGTTNPVSHSQNRRTLVVSDTTDGANVEIWGNSSGKSILQSVGGNTYVGNLANGSGNGTTYITSGNGSTYTTILANGNVGIGTTSPGSSLQIEAPAGGQQMFRVTNHTSAAGTFTNNYAAEIRSAYTTGAAGGALLVHTQEANDARPTMAVSDQNGVFTTFVNGKVGIGTTSPSNKLHVYGGRLVLDNVANAQTAIQINSAGVEKIVIYRPASTEDLRINTFSAGDVFSLTQSGNVGIGTTSPSSKLEVVGTLTVGNIGTSRFTDTSAFPLQLNRGLDVDIYGANGVILGMGTIKSGTYKDAARIAGGLESNTGTDGNFSVQTRGGDSFTTALHINSSQNVGIGTTSPGSRLQVKDSQDSSFDSGIGIIRSNSSQTGYINMVGGAMNINAPSGIPIKLRDGGATNVTISGDGNVGIGTTSPSEKLEVNGNVKADSFIGGNDAGIYTFNDTVNASSSEDIFSISNDHGAQAFRVTFVCSTTGYSVAKTYEVVHAYAADPVFFKVVDTGEFSGNDFDVAFATEPGGGSSDKKIICSITNNSTTINADIATTVFLGGSPTTITVTAL